MKFDNYEFKDYIVKAITQLGFKKLTDIQKKVIDEVKLNKNILAKSKTGSGKTHAFLIPIFQNLNEDLYEVQATIIAPTKELVLQIYKMAQQIASFCSKRIDIKLYSGGSDRLKEIEKLENSQPQIVIGTPGKIKDLAITSNALKIYKSKYFIIDEIDMTLDEGYKEELDAIVYVLKDSQTLCFSATIRENVLPYIKKYITNVSYIDLDNINDNKIEHIWIPLKHKDRLSCLISLTKIINPYFCIVFVNKKENIQSVSLKLNELGYKVSTMHGDMSPRERKNVLRDVSNLKYQYLVATDLAARGIDILGVSHIINYELPKDYEFYLHRSGRTGRMNFDGTVYSFYEEIDNDYLDNLAKKKIKPNYYEIVNGELIPYKGRNTRQERVKPKTNYYEIASKYVPKPDKVKPGYKKKRQEKIQKIEDKLKSKDKKKRYYK